MKKHKGKAFTLIELLVVISTIIQEARKMSLQSLMKSYFPIKCNLSCKSVLILMFMMCLLVSQVRAQYGGGSGTAEDPYQIWTPEQMNEIGADPNHSDDWDKHFILMDDIDLSGYDGIDGNPSFNLIGETKVWDGSNFVGNSFSGVFDGNGHTISNFTYVSTGVNHIGLFRSLDGDAVIKYLGLINPNVDIDTGSIVGGLVGIVFDGKEIISCYVQDGTISGGSYVGGLVGYMFGYMNIVSCYVEGGRVSGNSYIGGLLGHANGNIYDCYTSCSVTGTGDYVGGLSGRALASITNCYAKGSVTGGDKVGGLVGDLWSITGTTEMVITNSYSTGSVSGSGGHVGGLVGIISHENTNVINSFWDTQTALPATTSAGGTGKTTAEMQRMTTFTAVGWDLVGESTNGLGDIWAEPAGGGYPVFWWQLSSLPVLPSFSGGSGTAEDPYLISTGTELMNEIGHNPRLMESHFRLINDIDLSIAADPNFFFIGSEAYPFARTFAGDGYKILNFNYSVSGTGSLGLFGCVDGVNAEIKNLGVVNPNINASTTKYRGGVLVHKLKSGILDNCYVQGGQYHGSGGRWAGG